MLTGKIIEFFKNNKRGNVTLTRAKEIIWIIGEKMNGTPKWPYVLIKGIARQNEDEKIRVTESTNFGERFEQLERRGGESVGGVFEAIQLGTSPIKAFWTGLSFMSRTRKTEIPSFHTIDIIQYEKSVRANGGGNVILYKKFLLYIALQIY